MKLHQLIQGSADWHAHRATHFNASDAPAMMGCSPYKTRSQLLHEMHTGLVPEVDAATQRRFDDGHRFEALARTLAEAIIEDELYPVVGSRDEYSASFDGLTMDRKIGFEHKTLNNELRSTFAAIDNVDWNTEFEAGYTLPLMYRVQLEQQCMVSNWSRILFMASKWSGETLAEEHHCWYVSDMALADQIEQGWIQFKKDLEAFTPTAPTVQAVAAPVESLPAVSVRLDGQLVVASNLPEFGVALKAFISGIPTNPATDNEFATCEAACKALKKAEDALEGAETHALAQMTDVEAMRRIVADLRALARSTRLASEKMVTARKEQLRFEIVQTGRNALLGHVTSLNSRLGGQYMPIIGADFALAIKGKKSVDSIQDAVSTTLANAKIEASAIADRIQTNLETPGLHGYAFLFADIASICTKPIDDFQNTVTARITAHEAAQAKKEAEQRELIHAEEVAKLAREVEAKALAEKQAQDAITAAQATPVPVHAPSQPIPSIVTVRQVVQPLFQAPTSSVPTLKLGTIAERLGFTLTADFIASLGFEPAMRVKSSCLYHDHQFNDICAALVDHINSVCALQAA